MSQTPINITYSLEEVFGKINDKLDNFQKEVSGKFEKLDEKIEHLSNDVNDLKVGQARLEEQIGQVETKLTGEIKRVEATLSAKFEGLDKRLSNEETISRTAFGALVVAVLAGLVKYLFFPQG